MGLRLETGIYLKPKDRNRLEAIHDFLAKRMTRAQTAAALDVSERTVSRLAGQVSQAGVVGVVHKNRERSPWNKLDPDVLEKARDLILTRYQNFNILHAHEFLVRDHQIKISYSSLRRLCHRIHAVKRPKRRAKVRHYRPRHSSEGYLLQMDGSTHVWYGDEKKCLIAGIDDATSDIPYGEFCDQEGLWPALRVLRKTIEIKGIPWGVYVDLAGWFAGWDKNMQTQFNRVCNELGIRVIPAYSPQAKGRIERAWGTLQDRLIAEFGLRNIQTKKDANQYLNEVFLKETWRKKFTSVPDSEINLYRPVQLHQNLDKIFCLKYQRKVRNDHTVMYANERYEITAKIPYSIARRLIEIRVDERGEVEGWLNERNLNLQPLRKSLGNRYAS